MRKSRWMPCGSALWGGAARDKTSRARALVFLLLLAVLPSFARAAFVPGINARTLTHGGALRNYDVYAPASYSGAESVPLVIDLHGFGSNGADHRGYSGWTTKAETEGFLVVHPNGLFEGWNAGTCCGAAMTTGVDDVGFLSAMADAIVAEGAVSAERVYVTGLSNGGAMSHRMACEAADQIAAAAPMAFPVPYGDFEAQCQPSRPIPVLAFMGLNDVIIPYSAGVFGGAVASLDAWRAKNVCGTGPFEVNETHGFGGTCVVDTSCAEGVAVGLCSVTGASFAPPFDIYNGHILYFNLDGLVLADRAWTFLSAFSLPAAGVPVAGPLGWAVLGAGLAGAGFVMLRRKKR